MQRHSLQSASKKRFWSALFEQFYVAHYAVDFCSLKNVLSCATSRSLLTIDSDEILRQEVATS